MHELSHKYGTEDNRTEGFFHDAGELEDLMLFDVNKWADYIKLLRDCDPNLLPPGVK